MAMLSGIVHAVYVVVLTSARQKNSSSKTSW